MHVTGAPSVFSIDVLVGDEVAQLGLPLNDASQLAIVKELRGILWGCN
jgi:hypothetical protein